MSSQWPAISSYSETNKRKRFSFQKEENFNVDKNLRIVGEAGNIAENEQDVKFRIV